MEYYNCSKLVKFPLKDVVLKIYEFFNDKKADFISLSELYEFLREEFNVKSFNRANLVELLNADSTVDFNIVKDLYIKYVLSYSNILTLIKNALTDKIDDREIFMKGIDYSYYYEEENYKPTFSSFVKWCKLSTDTAASNIFSPSGTSKYEPRIKVISLPTNFR